jgi:hypothetical protein
MNETRMLMFFVRVSCPISPSRKEKYILGTVVRDYVKKIQLLVRDPDIHTWDPVFLPIFVAQRPHPLRKILYIFFTSHRNKSQSTENI